MVDMEALHCFKYICYKLRRSLASPTLLQILMEIAVGLGVAVTTNVPSISLKLSAGDGSEDFGAVSFDLDVSLRWGLKYMTPLCKIGSNDLNATEGSFDQRNKKPCFLCCRHMSIRSSRTNTMSTYSPWRKSLAAGMTSTHMLK